MPAIPLSSLNWLAVLTAGVAAFFLGAVWYQALFGKLWLGLHGYTREQVAAMQKARPPAVFFGTMIVAYLLMATAMALLVRMTNATSAIEGALVALVVWLVVQAIAATDFITSKKNIGVYVLDGAYQFCFLIMTGIIVALWR